MEEAYGAEQRGPSLSGSIASETGAAFLRRGFLMGETHKFGPVKAYDNIVKDYLVGITFPRQSTEELARYISGSGGLNWRRAVWGRPGVQKSLRLGPNPSIVGTPWAGSSWTGAARLLAGPDKTFSRGRIAYETMAQSAWHGADAKTMHEAVKAGVEAMRPSWAESSTRAASLAHLDRILRMGRFLPESTGVAGDLIYGSWFKANAWPIALKSKRAASYIEMIEAGGIKERIGSILYRGAAARELGAASGLVEASGFAKAATAAGGIAGKALYYYAVYAMARDVAKAGFAIYMKTPLATVKALGAAASRPLFSPADASLLAAQPTSTRMRAIQAIQGSRLNARSALGSEGALFANHFGQAGW